MRFAPVSLAQRLMCLTSFLDRQFERVHMTCHFVGTQAAFSLTLKQRTENCSLSLVISLS